MEQQIIDLTPLIQALIGILATLITGYAIPFIKSRTDAHKLDRLHKWAHVAVYAAEQIYPDAKSGKDKYDYALEFIRSKGFDIDRDDIDALIECEVRKLAGKE